MRDIDTGVTRFLAALVCHDAGARQTVESKHNVGRSLINGTSTVLARGFYAA